MRIVPILFNTEMVKAILDDRKTVTRRLITNVSIHHERVEKSVNGPYDRYTLYDVHEGEEDYDSFYSGEIRNISHDECLLQYCRYSVGDIIWVRETWQQAWKLDDCDRCIDGTEKYYYAAGPEDSIPSFTHWLDPDTGEHKDRMPWKPSIHMPKKAARIFLKVTDVRIERLQDIKTSDIEREGTNLDGLTNGSEYRYAWEQLWNSTVTEENQNYESNPWVWVIEFEPCEKPEGWPK